MSSSPNRLIEETSPYLLQHAYNPVLWYPWGQEAFDFAQKENKLVLISIGYSACHWCHVMERESFEDAQVAELMNRHFVCIKVDREERPDVDHIYMEAVQLMNNGHGGWPLNCFTLPDGKPIYGGTYFPKDAWMKLLAYLADFWQNRTEEAMQFGQNVTEAVQLYGDIHDIVTDRNFTVEQLVKIYIPWSERFDMEWGGTEHVPKFPLPVNWNFLLKYAYYTHHPKAREAVYTTLVKMAYGGIYDQLGGGFARYSTDRFWLVPHFEKMLYDNAQLITLYADAAIKYDEELFRNVVHHTLAFVERELTHPLGAFYSALDADSEGGEGKFYCWTYDELKEILPEEHFYVFTQYYGCRQEGNWEHGLNILHRKADDELLARELNLPIERLHKLIYESKELLWIKRAQRIRPGLDDKVITAWNGMMIKAYAHAYRIFGNESYLASARKAMQFITDKMTDDYRLFRIYAKDKRAVNAYLDDYAFVIDALLELYQATFEDEYILQAERYLLYATDHFFDDYSQLFFYTSDLDAPLIARKKEIIDNVIPASNSVMAHNLLTLGKLLHNGKYISLAKQMMANVLNDVENYGSSYANWASLLSRLVLPEYEISFIGSEALEKRSHWDARYYIGNIIVSGTVKTIKPVLPVIADKISSDHAIYVCKEGTCLEPTGSLDYAYKALIHDLKGTA
jgi:uncharacterized protein YyaL (SSP411 family)